jgi:hypothetical protein
VICKSVGNINGRLGSIIFLKITVEESHAVISKWIYNDSFFVITISYFSEEKGYQLKFFDKNQKPFNEGITNIMSTIGLQLAVDNYYVTYSTEDEIQKKLHLLCESFQKLTI